MGHREELIKELQKSDIPLSREQLAKKITKDPSNSGSSFYYSLNNLVKIGKVERIKLGRKYFFYLKGKKFNLPSTEPKDKKTQIKLEELVLRIFMSNDNKAFSEEDIVSKVNKNCLVKYELRGRKKRVSYILKELVRSDYISESMNGQLKEYTFNPKSMRIVYKDGTPKSIDRIATLDNYKNTLKKLYMKKVGYNLSLNELNDISGLDLTHGGKNIIDGFQQQIDLKEELSKKITDDNSEDVFYWIVYRWDRITENGKSSVACFVEDYKNAKGNKEELLEQFSKRGRVASWSKILSFLYPHDYFIYDARVAFTLDYLLGEQSFLFLVVITRLFMLMLMDLVNQH